MSSCGDSPPALPCAARPRARPVAPGNDHKMLKLNGKPVWHDTCIRKLGIGRLIPAVEKARKALKTEQYWMKTAAVTSILGLALISGALLAAATSRTGEPNDAAGVEFERLDRDGDGRISPREAEVNAGLSTHFRKFDRDGDGTLDREEFRSHVQPGSAGG